MEKSFNKHYLKRDPADREKVIEQDGKPVLGEIAKTDCRLEQRHANILNKNWRQTGIYYQEVHSTSLSKKDVDKVLDEARIALEKEATELGIKFRENIGDEKLQLKIKEAKGE